ncbi:hypothetical protein GDO78_012046 [Eleutherodactylus coqui]|uniref:Uncharacterized protein n=1 Tax=Eleutherodactylus coqui TaxID=57060 RepID=A0A8J6F439_ELECQ|nr:hypothetical protein GDO78_012046 [Eleutherodactylus coqui]
MPLCLSALWLFHPASNRPPRTDRGSPGSSCCWLGPLRKMAAVAAAPRVPSPGPCRREALYIYLVTRGAAGRLSPLSPSIWSLPHSPSLLGPSAPSSGWRPCQPRRCKSAAGVAMAAGATDSAPGLDPPPFCGGSGGDRPGKSLADRETFSQDGGRSFPRSPPGTSRRGVR